MKCQTKGHKFQKFDDESLFCERCGERRVITYRTWWGVIPPYPNWWYQPTFPPYIVWSDIGTTTQTITTSGWTFDSATLTDGSES